MPTVLKCRAGVPTDKGMAVCGETVVVPDPLPGQLKTEGDCPRCNQRYQVSHYPPPMPYMRPKKETDETH